MSKNNENTNITLVIASQTGKDVTTSLIVSRVFGKEHSKVCRDIETLSCSDSFRVANFGEATFENSKTGQTHKMYEITKDGFSFLVMGYTGEKAGTFKEKFIVEFNRREAILKNDDYILARSQEILQARLQASIQQLQIVESERDHYQAEVKQLTPKAQYTDEVLQSTSTYTFTQIAKDLGMRSVYVLTKLLQDKKIIYKQSGQWIPTAKYADKKYFDTRTAKYIKSDETIGTNISTVITEQGRQFLHTRLER